MMLREKVARAIYYAGRGKNCRRWSSLQNASKAPFFRLADAALAVVREALNEAEQTMLKAMAEAQDSGTTDLDCLLAYAMEASPLAEGNGDG